MTIDTLLGASVSLAVLFGGWCVRLEVHRQMISERLKGIEERSAERLRGLEDRATEARSHQEADRATLNGLGSQIVILSAQIKTLTELNKKLEDKLEKLVDSK
jgi:chromosome segregation ATPase